MPLKCLWCPLLLVCWLLISEIETNVQPQGCTTPRNKVGRCVVVTDCPSLVTFLRESPRPLSTETQLFIRDSHCGMINNIPGLCCEEEVTTTNSTGRAEAAATEASNHRECVTPGNLTGTCVNVEDCPLIASILRLAPRPLPPGVQDHIRKSNCGLVNNKIGLCCQSPSLNVQRNQQRGVVTPELHRRPITPSSGPIGDHPHFKLLTGFDCGPISSHRVVGGEYTSLDEFPWMALLKYVDSRGFYSFKCGGSIINKRYILTAAHCVANLPRDIRLYSIVLGEHDTRSDPDCFGEFCNPKCEELFFDRIISHGNYDNPKFANDIALIRLSQDLSFDQDYIQPICLPTTHSLLNKTLHQVIVAGWGATEGYLHSSELVKAKLRVVPMDDCRAALGQTLSFDEKQVCAQGRGIVDSCKGDSGGPLMWNGQLNGTARYVQFGIVSAGDAYCGKRLVSKPGIYVKVQRYMNWILDNIEE